MERDFVCNECGQRCRSLAGLNNHKARSHGQIVILESNPFPGPQPPNARPPNAQPPNAQPINPNQPPNVRPFDLNQPPRQDR